jgi:hypothetical protein
MNQNDGAERAIGTDSSTPRNTIAEGEAVDVAAANIELATKPSPDLSLAPGCFGFGLPYDPKSMGCRTCPFAAECGPLSTARLAEMRAKLGIVRVVESTTTRRRRSGRRRQHRNGVQIPVHEGARRPATTSDHEAIRSQMDTEAAWRTTSLNEHLSRGRLDKFFTKLKGRTNELVAVWRVRQELSTTGRELTAAEVARMYNERHSTNVSPRSMWRKLELVDRVEGEGMPWDKRKREPAGGGHGV